MNQNERLDYLITYLLDETNAKKMIKIPKDIESKRMLLRSLMNIREPLPIDESFLTIQDDYLQQRLKERGITSINDLSMIQEDIYLWRGDITTLKVDAIVNAANEQLLGCFIPCHGCIDNAIHTYAGIQLRLACKQIMDQQGHPESTGQAKITPGFNLPACYVIHTVGPIITNHVTTQDQKLLAQCYRSCLDLAWSNHLHSIAFCCISTGEFHFPNALAAQIAIDTVTKWQHQHPHQLEVIFNVYKSNDQQIYSNYLRSN